MLKIIESESNAWTIIAEDGELHIYGRDGGEWNELALSEDSEQVDPDKSALLEELYLRESGDDGRGRPEPRGEGEEQEEDEPEEDAGEEEDETEEPELEEEDFEDEEDEPEPQAAKPRRRRQAKTAGKR